MPRSMLRSFLFCPATRPDRVAKALLTDADAVIIDMEDAVALPQKAAARETVKEFLAGLQPIAPKLYLRINGATTPYAFTDLLAAVHPALDGIMLPKAEHPFEIQEVDWVISGLEREGGMQPGRIDLIPLLESAAGIEKAVELAGASPRVSRLAFGAIDFTLDIGTSPSQAGTEIFYARSRLVLASRVAGILPPVDSVYPWLAKEKGLVEEAKNARQLGFFGKLALHPAQVAPVNEAFTPTPAEVEYARKVVEAFRGSEREGLAAIQVEGKFVDYPVAARAQRVLELNIALSS